MWLNYLQIKSSVPLGKSSGVGFVSRANYISLQSLALKLVASPTLLGFRDSNWIFLGLHTTESSYNELNLDALLFWTTCDWVSVSRVVAGLFRELKTVPICSQVLDGWLPKLLSHLPGVFFLVPSPKLDWRRRQQREGRPSKTWTFSKGFVWRLPLLLRQLQKKLLKKERLDFSIFCSRMSDLIESFVF